MAVALHELCQTTPALIEIDDMNLAYGCKFFSGNHPVRLRRYVRNFGKFLHFTRRPVAEQLAIILRAVENFVFLLWRQHVAPLADLAVAHMALVPMRLAVPFGL